MKKVEREPIHVILAAIILIGMTIAYYIVHLPISLNQASAIASSFRELAILFLILALAGAIGRRLVPEFKASSLAHFSIHAALGLGILALAVLLLGSLLGLKQIIAWVALITLLIILRKEMILWLKDLQSLNAYWAAGDRFQKGIFLFTSLIIAFGLLNALAPPLKFDALVYHLSLPAKYLEAGRVIYVDTIAHWGFPQLPHMLSTLGQTLGMQRPALIIWAMGALTILGLLDHLKERLSSKAAWVSIAALLAGSSLASSLSWAYVDWASILMAWAMIYVLDQWIDEKPDKLLAFAAVFSGLAFGSKYTAALLAPLAALAIFFVRGKSLRSSLKFLGIALIVAGPWLIRNYLATSNPFYPLLISGGAMDEIRLNLYQGSPVQGNWLDFIFLPFRASLWGVENARFENAPGYEASLGPLLLAFSLFAWTNRARQNEAQKKLLSLSTVIAIGTLILWAIAGRLSGHLIRTHLYYSSFAAFAILAAFGFFALERSKLKHIFLIIVTFVLALNTLQLGIRTVNSGAVRTLIDAESEKSYLETNLGLHALVMKDIGERLPSNSSLLMLWEPRSYYCEIECDPDEIIDRWQHDYVLHGSSQQVLAAWKSSGYSHLLYYREAAQFVALDSNNFHPLDLAPLEALLSGLPIERDFNSIYTLYSLQQ